MEIPQEQDCADGSEQEAPSPLSAIAVQQVADPGHNQDDRPVVQEPARIEQVEAVEQENRAKAEQDDPDHQAARQVERGS